MNKEISRDLVPTSGNTGIIVKKEQDGKDQAIQTQPVQVIYITGKDPGTALAKAELTKEGTYDILPLNSQDPTRIPSTKSNVKEAPEKNQTALARITKWGKKKAQQAGIIKQHTYPGSLSGEIASLQKNLAGQFLLLGPKDIYCHNLINSGPKLLNTLKAALRLPDDAWLGADIIDFSMKPLFQGTNLGNKQTAVYAAPFKLLRRGLETLGELIAKHETGTNEYGENKKLIIDLLGVFSDDVSLKELHSKTLKIINDLKDGEPALQELANPEDDWIAGDFLNATTETYEKDNEKLYFCMENKMKYSLNDFKVLLDLEKALHNIRSGITGANKIFRVLLDEGKLSSNQHLVKLYNAFSGISNESLERKLLKFRQKEYHEAEEAATKALKDIASKELENPSSKKQLDSPSKDLTSYEDDPPLF